MEILRILPKEEIQKHFLFKNENDIWCLLGFSEVEIELNTIFYVEIRERLLLQLKEVILFDKRLLMIPIGIRICVKFSVHAGQKSSLDNINRDSDGYLMEPLRLTVMSDRLG